MSLWKRVLDTLIDPNLIVLLMSIGVLGITIEILNPGLILPGTVGAISLIIGLFGLQVLPVSWAGLLLMVLAAGFFVAEAFVLSHGALALAGAVSFVVGSLMLFDPAGEGYQVSIWVALAVGGTLALVTAIVATKIVQAKRAPTKTGREEMVGETGVVRSGSIPAGGLRPRRALARTRRAVRSRRASTFASTRRRGARPRGLARRGARNRRSLRHCVGFSGPARKELDDRRSDRRRRSRSPSDLPDLGVGADRTGVRAGRDLPARPPALAAEGAGPLPPHPHRRQDGAGRPADGDAEHPAAGGHHQGQRPRPRERGRVLPDHRPRAGDRAGRELHGRDVADRADDAAERARPARARRAPLRARQDQRDPPGDHRRGDVAVGHQGLHRRGQGRRDPERDAARDGAPGRGRARAARKGDRGRGRVPGLRAPQGRRQRHGGEPDRAAAPVPPDDARDDSERASTT